jgi:hypothetical protein
MRRLQPIRLALRWCLLVFAFAPALVPLNMIFRYGVNMPYFDQWDVHIAGNFIKANQGDLSFSDLAALHSEHRILIPRIAWLLLGRLTHWNIIAEMVLGWLITCGSSIGILRLICVTQGRFSRGLPTTFLPRSILDGQVIFLWLLSNLLIFSPNQWENWLMGSEVGFVAPFFLILALLAAISSLKPWPKSILATLFSFAATYSAANGMLAWPLCTPLLAFPSSKQIFMERKWPLAVWLASGMLLVGLYFVGYQKPLHGGSHPYATGILPILQYVPAFVGAPLADMTQLDAAKSAGNLMLAMYVGGFVYFAFRFGGEGGRELCRRGLVWLMFGGFVVLSGVEAGIGRGALTPRQALSSRYISFSLYLPIALVSMAWLICDDPARRRASRGVEYSFKGLAIIMGLAVIVLAAMDFPQSFASAVANSRIRTEAKGALLLIRYLPDNPVLGNVFSEPGKQAGYAERLNQIGYLHPPLIASNCAADFQETDADAMGGVQGKVESVVRNTAGMVVATGWAVLAKKSRPADAVFLTYDNEAGQPIVLTFAPFYRKNEDANRQLGENFGLCEWIASFTKSSLPKELKTTSLAAWALDVSAGKAFKLAGTVKVILRPG